MSTDALRHETNRAACETLSLCALELVTDDGASAFIPRNLGALELVTDPGASLCTGALVLCTVRAGLSGPLDSRHAH